MSSLTETEKKIRYYYHADFDKKSARSKILAEMPDYLEYEKEKREILENYKGDLTDGLYPMYVNPLLSSQQEYHLFKKMSYLRYCAVKLQNGGRKCDQKLIEKYLAQANDIRNEIAVCNLRLVSKLVKDKKYSFDKEDIIAQAYREVVKIVDYFDYNRGWKFSTYCLGALFKNFGRYAGEEIKYSEMMKTGEDFVKVDSSDLFESVALNLKIEFVQKLLQQLSFEEQVAVRRYFKIDADTQEYDTKKNARIKERAIKYLRDTNQKMAC